MKLTALLLTVTFLNVYANSHAQSVTFSGSDVQMKAVFAAIQKQTGYVVFGNADLLKNARPVTLNVYEMPLKDFLDIALKDQPFSYQIEDKTIYLSLKQPAASPGTWLLPQAIFPPVKVSGAVRNKNGIPLEGVSVRIKGGGGTSTNGHGIFELTKLPENTVLQISMIGYEPIELVIRSAGNAYTAVAVREEQQKALNVTAGENLFIDITMETSSSPLDEVQVQAYGQTSRRLSTGNIITIKASEIAKQPVNNPILALQGRVPNLVISPSSGLPGAPITLQLRGQNSLSAGAPRSEPLIIIDGIPFQNNLTLTSYGSFGLTGDRLSALSLVNPKDIEQIDVLADADATAIYGSRGGNGVIIITTKKGKNGQSSANLSVSTGYSAVARKLDLLNTEQYLTLRRDAYRQDGLIVPTLQTALKNETNYDLTLWDPNRETDWQEVFFGKVAPSLNVSGSVSGGNQLVNYRLGGNYGRSKFVFPGDAKSETGSASLSVNTSSASQKFFAGLNGTYSFSKAFTPENDFTSLAMVLPPNAPALYTDDGELNWEPDPVTKRGSWTNPFAALARVANVSTTNFMSNTDLRYVFSDHFTFSTTAGISRVQIRNFSINPIASHDPSFVSTGSAVHTSAYSNSVTVDPQLQYSAHISRGRLIAAVGGSYQYQNFENQNLSAQGYTADALLGSLGYAARYYSTNTTSEYKYIGFWSRVNFDWENKYILNLSGRRDGSSRFGPSNRFGNFWSVGGAWIFSNENFVQHALPWVGFGKLRFSYGSSGNDNVGDYQYIELYSDENRISYQGIRGLKAAGAVNPAYHWEDVRKLEAGLEFGLFRDRIVASVSRWSTTAKDQIGVLRLAFTAGAEGNVIRVNEAGAIQNNGWDFTLNTKNIDNKHFKWYSDLNFGIQTNKLLRLPGSDHVNYYLNRYVKVGEPFTGFVAVYQSKGVNPATGLYQFVDEGGNVSTHKDNFFPDGRRIGTQPRTIGISNSFIYKDIIFSFHTQLTQQVGVNHLYDLLGYPNGTFYSMDGFISGNLPAAAMDYWKKPGDNTAFQRLTTQPSEVMMTSMGKAYNSDLHWTDASFIQLRNVSLSYALPAAWIRSVRLGEVRFNVNAQNVLMITDYKGLDPETQRANTMPQLRTITFGLDVRF